MFSAGNNTDVAIIYPKGSKNSPGILYHNEEVYVENPFPGYWVMTVLEVYAGGSWTRTGWYRDAKEGSISKQLNDGRIYIRAFDDVICWCGGYILAPTTTSNVASAPFRVKVIKMDKM